MKRFRLVSAVFVWSASFNSIAHQWTIYGIDISAPLSIPECAFHAGPHPWASVMDMPGVFNNYVEALPTNQPCYRRKFENIGSNRGFDLEEITINYPAGKEPRMSFLKPLHAIVVNNRVERIWFNTSGLRTTSLDIQELEGKFGPGVHSSERATSGFGANYDIPVVKWSLEQHISVEYVGAETRIDEGVVVITTPAGEEAALALHSRPGSDI